MGGGARPENEMMQGLDQVIVCSTFDSPPSSGSAAVSAESEPPVSVRRFRILQQKSGSKLPRVEIEETGPRFVLTVDRAKGPDKEKWKQAIKIPKAAKPTKVKNVSRNMIGKRQGRLHLGRQDFDQIHTVHHGASKRKKMAESSSVTQAAKKTKVGKQKEVLSKY